jgi:hypothetical protein
MRGRIVDEDVAGQVVVSLASVVLLPPLNANQSPAWRTHGRVPPWALPSAAA